MQLNTNKSMTRRLLIKLKLLRDDNSGIAALEFAIIAPILILLFLGTLEVSLAVSVDRKVSRISSSIADLITRHKTGTILRSELDEFVKIADRIMFPYNDQVAVSIVAVKVINGTPEVQWRYTAGGGTAPAAGQPFPIPNSIQTDGSFLVSAHVKTDHAPAFQFVNYENGRLTFDGASIELQEQMFLRPRAINEFDCSGCN